MLEAPQFGQLRPPLERISELTQRATNWLRRARPIPTSSETERADRVSLRDYLLAAAKTEKLALGNLPRSFDLGEFGREAERLIGRSLADQQQPEYGSAVYLDRRGKLLLLDKPIRGDAHSIELPTYQGMRRVLAIHTHGDTDIPFSAADITFLVLSPSADREAGTAELLATPTQKMLVVRTKATPFFTASRAWWEIELNPQWSDDGSRELLHTGLRVESAQELGHQRMYSLSRVAEDYHLKIYSCPVYKNVAFSVS